MIVLPVCVQVLPYICKNKFLVRWQNRVLDMSVAVWTALNQWVSSTLHVDTHTDATLAASDDWANKILQLLTGPWAGYQTSGFAFPKVHLISHIAPQIRY